MKVQVIGIERSEGVSNKSGKEKAYSMATLHVMTKLSTDRNGEKNNAKGFMGDSLRVSPELVRKIEHLPFPVACELTVEDVMRFGKREVDVLDCVPLEVSKQPLKGVA